MTNESRSKLLRESGLSAKQQLYNIGFDTYKGIEVEIDDSIKEDFIIQ